MNLSIPRFMLLQEKMHGAQDTMHAPQLMFKRDDKYKFNTGQQYYWPCCPCPHRSSLLGSTFCLVWPFQQASLQPSPQTRAAGYTSTFSWLHSSMDAATQHVKVLDLPWTVPTLCTPHPLVEKQPPGLELRCQWYSLA